MINAKTELLNALKDKAKIKCAKVYKEHIYQEDESKNPVFRLSLKYTDEDLEKFYDSLNFNYDNGYGGQQLYGTVWLEDGTWLSRGEYDGSEWWDHNVLPQIPKDLLID